MARRRWRRLSLWALAALAVCLLLGEALWATRALAPAWARGLDEAQLPLALWRVTAFLLLIGLWPLWVERLARRYHWSSAHQAFVRAQRGRVALWLVVLELVLVQGVLVRFVQAVVG